MGAAPLSKNTNMNTKIKLRTWRKIGRVALGTLASVLLLMVVCVLLLPTEVKADTQGYPTTMGTATNLPPVIGPGTWSNSIASWIPVKQGRGLAVQSQFKLDAAGTGNVAYYLSPSVDGTNISGNVVWSYTNAANGTTAATATFNYARGALDGYNWVVLWGCTNAGTTQRLTNLGTIYQYPNN